MGEEIDGLWLFGYGSLIWKPPPHFTKRIPGYIEGYVRRFWQASQDHRGTPEAPGRVVTLIERSFWETLTDCHLTVSPHTSGVAYYVPPQHVAEVRSYLDIREINGYTVHYTPFKPLSPHEPPIKDCLVYIGTPENPQFIGPQDPQKLAEWIWKSKGPSGENTEYLFMMEKGLEELGEGDEHVRDLAQRVRAIETREKAKAGREAMVNGENEGELDLMRFRSGGSTDEQEEIEKENLT